jgi:hypothetical protein
MKTAIITALVVLVIGIGIVAVSRPSVPADTTIISRNGIHWHPVLDIYVKGEKIEIPANIGIGPQYAAAPAYGNGGMAMTAIHTHDDMPVIHLEFSGVVREDDIRLGNFFRVWGKEMLSFGGNMQMTVNGKESTEYENLLMHDGDKIELHYD